MQAKVKARGEFQPFVISANRLRDGRVVWLGADGAWPEDLAQAAVLAGAAVDAGLAAAALAEAAQHVVGAYLVEVARAPGGPVPLRAREKFRAGGPTILAAA